MDICKDTVVSIDYEITDSKNATLEKTTNENEYLVYLHGGYDGIFPKVEEFLEGKPVGATIDMKLAPDDTFGEIDEDLIFLEDVKNLPQGVKVGDLLEYDDEEGETLLVYITDIADGKAVLDGNHPWAGQYIRFVGKVVDVRQATDQELKMGRVRAGCCGEGRGACGESRGACGGECGCGGHCAD